MTGEPVIDDRSLMTGEPVINAAMPPIPPLFGGIT
jgi:hypothetical protein